MACHTEAASRAATDWPQILALYDLLGPNSLPPGTQRAAMRFPVATARWLSTAAWKFVRGQRLAEGGGSCQALGSLRYSPQAQSSASSGAPACSPLGRSESS